MLMEKLTFTAKEIVSLVVFIAGLIAQYYSLSSRVEVMQVEMRATAAEQQQLRENHEKIIELRLNALDLRIARLEAELLKTSQK